jgi:AcrR family transcriptional regulator
VPHQKNDNTRDTILMVATEMFFTMEYEKVTLNEIAKRVGVTKGGVYHYFDSKDDLLVAVLLYNVSDLIGSFIKEPSPDKSFKEVLAEWFNFKGHLDAFSNQDPNDYHIVFQIMYLLMLAIRKKKNMATEIGKLYDASIDVLVKMIETGQKSGELRPELSAKGIAYQLLAVVEGGMLVSIIRNDEDIEATGDLLFETIWLQIKA